MVQDQKDETVRGSLPLFKLRSKCLNAHNKFAAKLKYGDHQSSSSWKWFCVTLLAIFTSAYALGLINSRQGSLF